MSKLLLDENPLLVMPELARRIGLNESIVLQQIHYWNEINKKTKNNFEDGHYWTFNSYEEWTKQFPFWHKNTIARIMGNLKSLRLIVIGNYNKMKIDRTQWYRIDYEVLKILEESPFHQIGVTNIQEWYQHLNNVMSPLPEITTETYTEIFNNTSNFSNSTLSFLNEYDSNYKEEIEDSIATFYGHYQRKTGNVHPKLKEDQLKRVYDVFHDALYEWGSLDDMIKEFFRTVKNTDYNINHFATEGMLEILNYRVM